MRRFGALSQQNRMRAPTTLRLRGAGAGISTMTSNGASALDSPTIANNVFASMDVEQTGRVPVEDLFEAARAHFSTMNTVPPASWIRSQIEKHDDGSGQLDEQQFASAIDSLRRS